MYFEVAHELTLTVPIISQAIDPLVTMSQLTRMFRSTYSVTLEMDTVKDIFGYVSHGIA